MHTAKLRPVGGSTMVAIPPHILEALKLAPNATVGLTVERGKLVIQAQPRKGRIGLKARLAMCDFSKPASNEERGWTNGRRVGREEI
jgi:antitoxin ChpS